MEKEFVPIDISLELKELGFDEDIPTYYSYPENKLSYTMDGHNQVSVRRNSQFGHAVSAPTFSQSFRWFREKYNIAHSIDWMTRSGGEYPSGYIVHFRGINENILPIYNLMLNEGNLIVLNNTEFPGYEVFPTYEEAELSCLKKLIEIVKNK